VLLGAHCSGGVKKALDRAVEIGADAVQLFVQSPRAWRFPEHDPADLAAFRERREEAGIGGVLVHALYLINLASPNDELYEKSVRTMCSTMDTACAIEADGVVFHVGSHQGAGFDTGLERVVPGLAQVLDRANDTTWLLLENSAGAGGTIGRSLEELATIVDRLDGHRRLGLCLDTCHLYVSGWDVTDRKVLDRLLREVDRAVGLDRLRALHANDSKAPLGSNRDRHENVGSGLLGEELGVFLGHPKLQRLPTVLETPGPDGHGPDAAEMKRLRDLHGRWTRRKKK
jgi:deoxyribonuclease-4